MGAQWTKTVNNRFFSFCIWAWWIYLIHVPVPLLFSYAAFYSSYLYADHIVVYFLFLSAWWHIAATHVSNNNGKMHMSFESISLPRSNTISVSLPNIWDECAHFPQNDWAKIVGPVCDRIKFTSQKKYGWFLTFSIPFRSANYIINNVLDLGCWWAQYVVGFAAAAAAFPRTAHIRQSPMEWTWNNGALNGTFALKFIVYRTIWASSTSSFVRSFIFSCVIIKYDFDNWAIRPFFVVATDTVARHFSTIQK